MSEVDRMGNIERKPTAATACPTCGQAVTVVSSDEGTSYYSGLDVREVYALREELRGAVEALRLIADPPMGDDYTAPREYAEFLRDQARRALANLGGQS